MEKEDYTRRYITTALFKLMSSNDFSEISVSDIARKAGVGRATFYRHFKHKEDIIANYFATTTEEFTAEMKFKPRYDEDYRDMVRSIFEAFKKSKETIKLLKKANLENIYLEYITEMIVKDSSSRLGVYGKLTAVGIAGALYNISMDWLKDDCRESIDDLVKALSAISHL